MTWTRPAWRIPPWNELEALSQRLEFLEKLLDDQFLKERA